MASSSDEDAAIVGVVCALVHEVEKQTRQRRKRKVWVRPWLLRRETDAAGAYASLLRELAAEDKSALENFLRMDLDRFNKLLQMVGPAIQKQDTVMRQAIPPGERLAVTLRFLASGNRFQDLQYLYRIPTCTISRIVLETCEAIYSNLKSPYLKTPQSEEEWRKVAEAFQEHWNFPNCLGALDGKHIAIKAPATEGSAFYNYKHFHSVILLALVDANLKFLYVDVGANGRAGDAGVFRDSPLYRRLEDNTLNVPSDQRLPGMDSTSPFVIVGDDAFPLKTYLLKPYPDRGEADPKQKLERRVFNYRLSRARRCSENAFGLLVQRFGIFQSTIQLNPQKVTIVTQAALCLHNFLIQERDRKYTTPLENATCRPQQHAALEALEPQSGNKNSEDSRAVRDQFKTYFNGPGQVPWQHNFI